MNERDRKVFDAYELVRKPVEITASPAATQAKRLLAHHTILEFGMHEAGETARQMQMAEAIADICLGLAIRLERAG